MIASPTSIPGVQKIQFEVHQDLRGSFMETYREDRFLEMGIKCKFSQTNESLSNKGVLRGLHAQLDPPQAKLVRPILGEIYDVVVDIRVGSPTFRKWSAHILRSDAHEALYVPEGFAHGFCVLSDQARVEYQCSGIYNPKSELTLFWNDPELNISWPIENPSLSKKDAEGLRLNELLSQFPKYSGRSKIH